VVGNPEHWERKEFIEPDWEQSGNKSGNTGNIVDFSRPSDTAIRACPLDAPDTATSLAPVPAPRTASIFTPTRATHILCRRRTNSSSTTRREQSSTGCLTFTRGQEDCAAQCFASEEALRATSVSAHCPCRSLLCCATWRAPGPTASGNHVCPGDYYSAFFVLHGCVVLQECQLAAPALQTFPPLACRWAA